MFTYDATLHVVNRAHGYLVTYSTVYFQALEHGGFVMQTGREIGKRGTDGV